MDLSLDLRIQHVIAEQNDIQQKLYADIAEINNHSRYPFIDDVVTKLEQELEDNQLEYHALITKIQELENGIQAKQKEISEIPDHTLSLGYIMLKDYKKKTQRYSNNHHLIEKKQQCDLKQGVLDAQIQNLFAILEDKKQIERQMSRKVDTLVGLIKVCLEEDLSNSKEQIIQILHYLHDKEIDQLSQRIQSLHAEQLLVPMAKKPQKKQGYPNSIEYVPKSPMTGTSFQVTEKSSYSPLWPPQMLNK